MSRIEAMNIRTMGQGSIPRGGPGGSPPPPAAPPNSPKSRQRGATSGLTWLEPPTSRSRTIGQGGQPRQDGGGGGGPPPPAPPNSPAGN